MDTTYDGAGNVVLDTDQRAYTWDPLGMMTSATVDGRTFRYIYNANNERIAAVERVPVGAALRNRTTFTLRGAGNQLLSTWTDDWTSGSRVFTRKEDTIWRGSQLLARAYGTNTMNYTLDHLGSPRLITNGSGSVLDQQNFEPFGGGGLNGSGALQFTGHERDQANLGGGSINLPDYFHARFYDKAGRFLSVDPVMLAGRNLRTPQRWNRYAYALNNPLLRVDPDGKKDTIYVINTVGGGAFNQTALNRLNTAVSGTRFEGRVQVIGPMASRGQVQAWMGHADRSDMVGLIIHSGGTKDWKPALGGFMMTQQNLGDISKGISGTTLAAWAGANGTAPGVCMIAGCNSGQIAATVQSATGTVALGTNNAAVAGEQGLAVAATLGALAQGQSPEEAAAAGSQQYQTPPRKEDCPRGGAPGCDPSRAAELNQYGAQ